MNDAMARREEAAPVEDNRDAGRGTAERIGRILGSKYVFAIAFLLILLIAVYIRSGMLRYQGFFEPDGFYYYSIVKETVSNNFVVPAYSALSGFPTPNTRGEQPGLIYLTVLPYMLLQYFGISYYTIMRLLPVLFGVLYAILAYFLARQLSNSRLLGLLAAFFVAASSGNVARTAALVYRGDSFIALPLMVALLLMLQALKDEKHRVAYALLASLVLSTGILIWTGSALIIAVYMFALMLLVGYGFVTGRKDFVETNALLAIDLFLAYALEHLYVYIGAARVVSPLYNSDFLVFYVPLLIASLAAVYLIRNKERFAIVGSTRKRIIIVLAVVVIVAAIAFFPLTSYIIRIVEGTGAGNNANNPIGATTQELQHPTFGFMFASFNMQLYLAPIGVLLFLLMALASLRLQPTLKFLGGAFGYSAYLFMNVYLFLIPLTISNVVLFVLIAIFAAYFLYVSEEYAKGHPMTSGMYSGFVAASVYLAVTAYMQSLVIRYNALLSIPLAIFAAYCLYAIWEIVKDKSIERMWLVAATAGIADVVMLYFAVIRAQSGELGSSFLPQAAGSALVVVALVSAVVYSVYAVLKRRMCIGYLFIAVVAAILIFNLYGTCIAGATAGQADGINPLFLDAMTWMSQNTPKNATVWAVWPDGSVIEGWANRTSYLDSVGGEYAARIMNSSDFLFNTSPDTQYLYRIGKPQYLVARGFWYSELGGLAAEGLVQNTSDYGYVPLNSLHITQNGTQEIYSLESTSPPYYKAVMVLQPGGNGTNAISGYIGTGASDRLAAIKYVILYNQAGYSYNMVGSQVVGALNYTLLVTYYNRTITGGAILGASLPSSNLFRFTFLCNYDVCPYGDGNVSMKAVYINDDTRIFEISYR